MRKLIVTYEIDANAMTCGKCEKLWKPHPDTGSRLCDVFDGAIHQTHGGRWLRLEECRKADVTKTGKEGL